LNRITAAGIPSLLKNNEQKRITVSIFKNSAKWPKFSHSNGSKAN
jgi:hypothetical protein